MAQQDRKEIGDDLSHRGCDQSQALRNAKQLGANEDRGAPGRGYPSTEKLVLYLLRARNGGQ